MRGRALPFIPLKPWQVEYLRHLYPDHFQPDEELKIMSPLQTQLWFSGARRLVFETDWDSPEAKTWERVWEEAERKAK